MLQNIIVYCLVAFSLAYLSNNIWKRYFKKNESCDGCAMNKSSKPNEQN